MPEHIEKSDYGNHENKYEDDEGQGVEDENDDHDEKR